MAAGCAQQVSVRWIAQLEAALTETLTPIAATDDGVPPWLDGWLHINDWTDRGTADNRAEVDPVAG